VFCWRVLCHRLLAIASLAIILATGFAAPRLQGSETSSSFRSPTPAYPGTSQTDTALRREGFAGPLAARLVRVIDGDTFEARVRIWFGEEVATLVRIRGIDAPELKARCPEEARRAVAARDLLDDFLGSGAIALRDVAADKYFGRVVASVSIGEGDDVAGLMLAAAMARPYQGRTRESWCGVESAAR
jgi:endonuclease YncB( thermonuclease family)